MSKGLPSSDVVCVGVSVEGVVERQVMIREKPEVVADARFNGIDDCRLFLCVTYHEVGLTVRIPVRLHYRFLFIPRQWHTC